MTGDQRTVNRKTNLHESALTREARARPVTGHGSPVASHKAKRWYREPWLWLLMAGPAAVLVAGAITIFLAVWSDDGLVADDYYRRGLAINQTLARDQLAARLGLHATVRLLASGVVQVTLKGEGTPPPALVLRLVHPTRAGEDWSLSLSRAEAGVYRGQSAPLPSGRRDVILEDDTGTWRLTGEWTLPSARQLQLVPRADWNES